MEGWVEAIFTMLREEAWQRAELKKRKQAEGNGESQVPDNIFEYLDLVIPHISTFRLFSYVCQRIPIPPLFLPKTFWDVKRSQKIHKNDAVGIVKMSIDVTFLLLLHFPFQMSL